MPDRKSSIPAMSRCSNLSRRSVPEVTMSVLILAIGFKTETSMCRRCKEYGYYDEDLKHCRYSQEDSKDKTGGSPKKLSNVVLGF